jgi:AcrR family transcriptional regulator
MSARKPDRSLTAQRVWDEAARLFWKNGYAATSTRELAEAIGIQKASLFHHIGSKERLLFELCADSLEKMDAGVRQAIEEEDDPVARIRRMVVAHVTFLLEDRDKHAIMLTELRSLSPVRQRRILELRSNYEHLVRDTIAGAQRAGGLREDISAQELSLGLFNLLNWTIFWYDPEHGKPDQLADMFGRLFFEGAAAPGHGEGEARRDGARSTSHDGQNSAGGRRTGARGKARAN